MKNIAFILFACLLSFTTFAQKKTTTTKQKTTTAKSKTAVTTKKADPEAQKKIDEATAAFDKELQGTWKLNEITSENMYVNATTKEMKFSDESEKDRTEEQRKASQEYNKVYLMKVAASSVIFDGKNISYYLVGSSKKGTYILKKNGEVYNVDITLSDGTKDAMEVSIKGRALNAAKKLNGNDLKLAFVKFIPKPRK